MAEKIKAIHRKAGSCVGGYAGSNPAQGNNFCRMEGIQVRSVHLEDNENTLKGIENDVN